MKSIITLGVAAAVAFTIPYSVDAANINVQRNTAKYGTFEGVKLNDGVTMYPNAQKALFANDGKTDVKTALIDAGARSADVYTVLIKNENEMNYAVFANVMVGTTTPLVNTKHVSADTSSVGNLVSSINSGNATDLGSYRVIAPLTKQGNAYVGTLKYTSQNNNNSYNEILHVAVSDSRYGGPNARFIAIDEESDAKVFPKISHLLTQKTK